MVDACPSHEPVLHDVRPLDKALHLETIKAWWAEHYKAFGYQFPAHAIPDKGIVVYHKGAPAAACFLYTNETKLCHAGFSIADPGLGAGRRAGFLAASVEATIALAKQVVGSDAIIIAMTDHAVAGRIYQESGFKCLGEGDLFAYSDNPDSVEFLR